jgi:hypothetical protein
MKSWRKDMEEGEVGKRKRERGEEKETRRWRSCCRKGEKRRETWRRGRI